MFRRLHKKGFTLLELSISMLFVSLLSIAVVMVINNTIASYQRGTVLSRLDSVGSSLVEDVRASIQNALNRTMLGKNISIVRTSTVTFADGSTQDLTPIYGVFCSGSYTYFWNSGYYFSSDASFPEKSSDWIKLKFSDTNTVGEQPFRLIKVKDEERDVCLSIVAENLYSNANYTDVTIDNSQIGPVFDVSKLINSNGNTMPEIISLLQNDNSNDLALYNLEADAPVTNFKENKAFYNISITLGTTTGGVEIDNSNPTCATPLGDVNWSNSCAVSKFNFGVQSDASADGISEQSYQYEIGETPPFIEPKIIYSNADCATARPPITVTKNNTGTVELVTDIGFSCVDESENLEFLGWNTDKNGSGTWFARPGAENDRSISKEDKQITLYAKWKPITRIKYVENCDGSTRSVRLKNTGTVAVHTSIGNPPTAFTCGDAEFLGWDTNSSTQSNPAYNDGSPISIDNNYTLYAIWKKKVYYTVTFYGNGNTNNLGTTLNSIITISNILEGSTLTMPGTLFNDGTEEGFRLQKRNSVFDGWGVTPTDLVASYKPGNIITVNSNMDFYAIWSKDIGGVQNGYTETPNENDMIINVLTIFPPYNTNFNLNNTGNFANTAIRPLKITLEGEAASDEKDFTETLPYTICKSFTTQSDGKIGCGDFGTNFTARIYLLRGTGGSPAVLYLPINERTIPLDKSLYITYISDPKDLIQVNSSPKQSYSYAGMNGTPIALPAFPYRFDFSDYDIEDTIIATGNLPNIITGANGTVDSSTPRYWVIAAIRYNGSSKKMTIDEINRFTDAEPSSFAH